MRILLLCLAGSFPQAFPHLAPVGSAALLRGDVARHHRQRVSP